jgi:hypothetical protein
VAAATLVLDVPQLVTLEAVGTNLRKVVLPVGTRYLEYSSAAAWFLELAAQSTADGAAGTAAAQQRFDPGTDRKRAPQSGAGRSSVRSAWNVYLAGSGAAQQVWLTAVSMAP